MKAALWFRECREYALEPEIHNLADRLGVPDIIAVGLISQLHRFCTNHARDGDITKVPPRALARALLWDYAPGQLVAAPLLIEELIASGNVDRTGDGRLVVHGWIEYNGKIAAFGGQRPQEDVLDSDDAKSSLLGNETPEQLKLDCTADRPLTEEEKLQKRRADDAERQRKCRARKKAVAEQLTGQENMDGSVHVGGSGSRDKSQPGHVVTQEAAKIRDMSRDTHAPAGSRPNLNNKPNIPDSICLDSQRVRDGPHRHQTEKTAGSVEEVVACLSKYLKADKIPNKQTMKNWINWGFSIECIELACEYAVDNEANNFGAYMTSIISGWRTQGIKDSISAKAYYESRIGRQLYADTG